MNGWMIISGGSTRAMSRASKSGQRNAPIRWCVGLWASARPRWNFAHVKSFGRYEMARGTPGIPGAHSSVARSQLPASAAAS